MHFAQTLLQIRDSERNASSVRVEHHGAFGQRALHQEVPRETHALQRQAYAAADLHVQQAERNRNADATFQHLVEATVARVVVVPLVGGETEFREQELIERQDALRVARIRLDAQLQSFGQFLDARQMVRDV